MLTSTKEESLQFWTDASHDLNVSFSLIGLKADRYNNG